jgi:hypothetical protein
MINCIFEFSQKYKALALGIIPSWLDSMPLLDNTKNFITNGIFDVMDIYSIFAGTITAFCVLVLTFQKEKKV